MIAKFARLFIPLVFAGEFKLFTKPSKLDFLRDHQLYQSRKIERTKTQN